MSKKVSLVIVFLGMGITAIIAYLDKLDTGSVGLIQILVIDLVVTMLLFIMAKYVKFICKMPLIALFVTNVLLLFNTSGWNEGRMAGTSYIFSILQPATDLMYALLLFSAFSLGIPLIIYIIFLVALSKLVCKNAKQEAQKEINIITTSEDGEKVIKFLIRSKKMT